MQTTARSSAALTLCWQRLLPRQRLFTASAAGGRKQLFGREFVAATAAVIAADSQLEPFMRQQRAADGRPTGSGTGNTSSGSRPPLLLLPSGEPVSSLSWPGHGSMLFWQLGVMDGLQQAWGAEQVRQLHLIGSSSGGLLAVLAACGVPPGQAISTATGLAAGQLKQRRLGLTGAFGPLLLDWLQLLLPPDAAARCSGRATLLATAMPWLYNVHVSSFATRDDVVAAAMASAHIPWLMSRRLTAPLQFPPLATGASAAAAGAGAGCNSRAGGSSATGSSSSGAGDTGSLADSFNRRVSAWATAATGGPAGAASSRAVHGTTDAQSSSGPNSTAGLMQRLQHSRLWRTNRCIDGNWWMHVKSCFRGFAPHNGSAALLLEPQQDEALPPLLQQLSPSGAARLPGLALLSERQAWQLFEHGRAFAARAAAGDAACLIIRRRTSECRVQG